MSGTLEVSPAAPWGFNTLCQIDPLFLARAKHSASKIRTAHFPQKDVFLGTSFASILLCVLNPRAAMPRSLRSRGHRRADYFFIQQMFSAILVETFRSILSRLLNPKLLAAMQIDDKER